MTVVPDVVVCDALDPTVLVAEVPRHHPRLQIVTAAARERRTMHDEEDRLVLLAVSKTLAPQIELHIALLRPMLFTDDLAASGFSFLCGSNSERCSGSSKSRAL